MNGDGQVQFPLVTRVEVIDSDGRAFVEYLDSRGVSVQMQDNGMTMKIYVTGSQARNTENAQKWTEWLNGSRPV